MDWSKCKKKEKMLQLRTGSKKVDWSKRKKKRENAPVVNRKQRSGLE